MNPMHHDDTEQQVKHLAAEWAAAEQRGDTAALDRILTDDFVGIGPRGFTLTKQEWLQRHQAGALVYDALSLDDIQVRVYGGDTAIMVARETQAARYQGQPMPGEFRTTLVWVRQDGDWRLAGTQLSPIMPPPAPPSR